MKYVIVLSVLFCIVPTLCAIPQKAKNDCDLNKHPMCSNKTHPLCNTWVKSVKEITNLDSSKIVELLNKYRTDFRNSKLICNLPNLLESNELKNMTYATLNLADGTYCRVTKTYRNLKPFSRNFDCTNNDTCVVKKFKELLKRNPTTLSWIYSVYLKEIGCVAFQKNETIATIVCMMNGPLLYSGDKTYGYGNECDRPSNIFTSNSTCDQNNTNCKYQDHFVCWAHPTKMINTIELNYTTILFLIQKLRKLNNFVEWDFNLQYLAEQIAKGNLTGHDQCLAKRYYAITKYVTFGKKYLFLDQISNIEYLVTDQKQLSGPIGCTFYYVPETDKIVLYCLMGENIKSQTILDLIFFSTCNELDIWLIYGLILLTYLDVLGAIVLLYSLTRFQQQHLIFSFIDNS